MCVCLLVCAHMHIVRKCISPPLFCRQFDNAYIGWGLKYQANPFNPPLPSALQEEFPTGADINETTDPSVEQEQALKKAQEEAEANLEEEEEADDDDDD